ncbi:MAG: Asp-tRNA(Asn)/Glu-tRNA(Gln) amidotransferase subunit GatC [Acutalibacteraceae bacterium]
MVSHEDVIQIARLAKLSVKEEDLEHMTKEMQKIVDFADAINNAPTDSQEFDNINNLSNAFRQDDVLPSYPVEDIISNAKDKAENCFLVKKHS